MRRRDSEAWLELMPPIAVLNAEAHLARQLDRQERAKQKEDRAAVPVRRVVGREMFAKVHAVIDMEGEV